MTDLVGGTMGRTDSRAAARLHALFPDGNWRER